MLEGKELMDKLYEQAVIFDHLIRNKRWPEAKHCYDTVASVLVFLEAPEGMMLEFFGERGERGVILKEGLFPEDKVQKAYYETAVKRDGGYENKKYEPVQKNSA